MKIKFVHPSNDIAGYFSLKALVTVKGWLSACGNYAEIPPEYTLVTNGEIWNVEKIEK